MSARLPATRSRRLLLLFSGLVIAGALLRLLQLAWQPLWWDEGYSVYFATEPLGRMIELTARDIHPPLYYSLLHGWFQLLGATDPVTARLLSVLWGILALALIAGLARALAPRRPRVALLALFLLAISPMHLYYSQEIRMYGQAVALGMAASWALWLALHTRTAQRRLLALYGLLALLGLYTLYYFAFLLLGHFLWALWRWRRSPPTLRALVVTGVAIMAGFLPWLLYAGGHLVGYVGGKVASDQDLPLDPLTYLLRHATAFVLGHLPPATTPAAVVWLLPLLVALLWLAFLLRRRSSPVQEETDAGADPVAALLVWLAVPVAVGWLISLRYPFFPTGGERLLLIALPYAVLMTAFAIDGLATNRWSLLLLAAAPVAAGVLGVLTFFSSQRYQADDFRPLIRHMVQAGNPADVQLAIFPWQVGYWRAYAPGLQLPFENGVQAMGPQMRLLSDGAVEWGAAVQAELDSALAAGVVWFPEPLGFGSTLPPAMERYLAANAAPVENRWFGATRLTAWSPLPPPAVRPLTGRFGSIEVVGGGVASGSAPANNRPVAVTVASSQPFPPQENYLWVVTLEDGLGREWSSRIWSPADDLAGAGTHQTVGLPIPAGTPPGVYTVTVGIAHSAADRSVVMTPVGLEGSGKLSLPVGQVNVVAPEPPWPAVHLPIDQLPTKKLPGDQTAALQLLGSQGLADAAPQLSGTPLEFDLFVREAGLPDEATRLLIRLISDRGAEVTRWEGWPLPEFPPQSLHTGELVRLPIALDIGGYVESGAYAVLVSVTGAGFSGPEFRAGAVTLQRRTGTTEPPDSAHPFADPPLFGSHVRLLGYDIAGAGSGELSTGQLDVRLFWQVEAALLPSHHIFLHAIDPAGEQVGQQDGIPLTNNGLAPSGSWQPGEYLTTIHRVLLPAAAGIAELRVGLYEPKSGIRLPVSSGGDFVVLPR
jgi:4-amino-4-deoxy-L-arabinose transferase-like glycosyltransferase